MKDTYMDWNHYVFIQNLMETCSVPIVIKKLPEEVRRVMLRSHDETT